MRTKQDILSIFTDRGCRENIFKQLLLEIFVDIRDNQIQHYDETEKLLKELQSYGWH